MTRPSISSEKLREYMRRYRNGEPIDALAKESGNRDLLRAIHRKYGKVTPSTPVPTLPRRPGARGLVGKWSEREDEILRQGFTYREMERVWYLSRNLPGRTLVAAQTRASALGLTDGRRRRTPAEDAKLPAIFAITDKAKRRAMLEQALPTRTLCACATRYFLIKQSQPDTQQEAS